MWSIGATGDGESRSLFSSYLRHKCKEVGVAMPFPRDGLVYDYKLEDGGVSQTTREDDDDDDDTRAKSKVHVHCRNRCTCTVEPLITYT